MRITEEEQEEELYAFAKAMPVFEDGHLLKSKMLEAVSDQAFWGIKLLFQGYSDGILTGCELKTTKDSIIVNEGMLLHHGQVVLIKQPMSILYAPTNEERFVKLEFREETRKADVNYQEMELCISNDQVQGEDEIELCRFKLQEGAYLRDQYQDFEDRNTEFDTIQSIHVLYAAIGGSTLSPTLVAHFAKEMLEAEELSDIDTLFCLQLLKQESPVNKQTLLYYLKRVWKTSPKDSSNLSIYKELVKILRSAKGMGTTEEKNQKKKWRLMVD